MEQDLKIKILPTKVLKYPPFCKGETKDFSLERGRGMEEGIQAIEVEMENITGMRWLSK